MIALDTQITLPAVRQIALRAWTWWAGEILAAIPDTVKRRISRPRDELLVQLSTNAAVVSVVGDGQVVSSARIDFDREDMDWGVAEAEPLFQALQTPRIHIRLSRAMILRREIDLPRSAESRLRQVVALDLDRQTPFLLEDAVFDAVVEERDASAGRIRVGVVVAKRSTIEAAVALCGRFGAYPTSITIDDADGNRFNLLPANDARRNLRLGGQRWVWFSAAIGLLIALNIGLSFHRYDVRMRLLAGELVTARKEAQATEKFRGQLARYQSEARLLAEAHNEPSALLVLRELTHILPDDVWLFEFEMNNGVVKIGGLAPSATDLTEKLDKSDRFANAQLKNTTMRADGTAEDRFEITVDLRPQVTK